MESRSFDAMGSEAWRSKMQDVVVVGAGAAGIGCGVMLQQLGVERLVILDRERTGASFDRWPEEMRFITPSFTSNAFGMLDLNAIAPATSPAFTLKVEHPTGRQYASYLRGVAQHFELPVRRGVDVTRVVALKDRFRLHTSMGTIHTRFVIWAAGEFQYPNLKPFPGAELCLHSSKVIRWADLKGEEHIVIGGYESGADAAIHLSNGGSHVTLIDAGAPWEEKESDPSVALSPYTIERLAAARSIDLVDNKRVRRVVRREGYFEVIAEGDVSWRTKVPPILAAGYTGGLSPVRDLFKWTKGGDVMLTSSDESTSTPGLFVAGPQLRHQRIIFCFIYKFRQRFAVVGREIATRLELPLDALEAYKEAGMLLDDLSCCKAECKC
jgi:putative flavoprotein involved in K+ transport